MTLPSSNRIRKTRSVAMMLLVVAGLVLAPLLLAPQVEHSHPLAADGTQLDHHHGHHHHHHGHSHSHHAKTNRSIGPDGSRTNGVNDAPTVSSAVQHQHVNWFGLRLTLQTNGDAAALENNRGVDFGLLFVRVLDIRSPAPPADVTVEPSLRWQPLISWDCPNTSCDTRQPDTPPPEFACC